MKESKSAVIRIGGFSWHLSLEPELDKNNSVPNMVDAARAYKACQEDTEVASQ